MNVESIFRILQNLLFARIVITRVDYTQSFGVFLLGREDRLEEDAFTSTAGVAEGVEEADDSIVGRGGLWRFVGGRFDTFPLFGGGR